MFRRYIAWTCMFIGWLFSHQNETNILVLAGSRMWDLAKGRKKIIIYYMVGSTGRLFFVFL